MLVVVLWGFVSCWNVVTGSGVVWSCSFTWYAEGASCPVVVLLQCTPARSRHLGGFEDVVGLVALRLGLR